MPANTMNEMILGFAVILGTLGAYALSLIIRTKAAKKKKNQPRQ